RTVSGGEMNERVTATAPDADLNLEILLSHAIGQPDRLVALYRQAGHRAEGAGRTDEACFFFTQAYVFALECGDTGRANALKATLKSYGRER
ncbi:MAG: hypothetical protein ACR2PM_11175, partial [Hyphomicrobiales bacterium]